MDLAAELQVLFQVIIALLLGGLIGWERESAGKWAGFRTHMLLCISAMLFVRLGQFVIVDTTETVAREVLRADPTRILEAIATGVAFLGAGTIFLDRDKDRARGLTTAASLLITTVIGIAVAIERYLVAAVVTVIAVIILRLLVFLEERAISPSSQAARDRKK